MADPKDDSKPESTEELSDDVLDTVAGGTAIHTEALHGEGLKADIVHR